MPLVALYAALVLAVSLAAAAESVRSMVANGRTPRWSLCDAPWTVLPLSLAVYSAVPAAALLAGLLPRGFSCRGTGSLMLFGSAIALLSVPVVHIIAAVC